MFEPCRQVSQLYVQHRGLDIIEERRLAVVPVLTGLPILSIETQQADGARDTLVVSSNCTTIAKAPEDLKRVEAETASIADAAGAPAVVRRTQSLSRILNNHKRMVSRDAHYRIYVA